MRFLDTDVMVDILRGYQPALKWLDWLGEEELGIPGFVAMELMEGCADKRELDHLQNELAPYLIYWPTEDDCERALSEFASAHLSQGLGVLDALIGECAVGANAVLCTFNKRHFKAIPGLVTEQPYERINAGKSL